MIVKIKIKIYVLCQFEEKKSYRNTLNYTQIFFQNQNISVKIFRKKLVGNCHGKKDPKKFHFFSTFKFFFFCKYFCLSKKNIRVKIYENYLFCVFIRQTGAKYV